MTERFKVNKEEFLFLQKIKNLKAKGISEEDILQLDRSKEITKENMQRQRLQTIKLNKVKIKQFQRMIDYKKEQIKNKEFVEKSEAFVNGKKPEFMLQNEIEEIETLIENLEELNKTTQEEHDKNAM